MAKIDAIDAALDYISALGANYREAIKARDAALKNVEGLEDNLDTIHSDYNDAVRHILSLEDMLHKNGIGFVSFDQVRKEKSNR